MTATTTFLHAQKIPSTQGVAATNLVWTAWIASLPLAHATALHSLLGVTAICLTILFTRREGIYDIPGAIQATLLLALAALSFTWSFAPAISASRFRSDLLLPTLGYGCAYLWARDRGGRPFFFGFAAALGLLTACSVFEYVPNESLKGVPFFDTLNIDGHLLPRWYPGVGDASSFAAVIIPVMIAWRGIEFWRRRYISLLLIGCVLVVVVVSKNRNAVTAIPIGCLLFAMAWHIRAARRAAGGLRNLRAALVVIGLVLASTLVCALTIERFSQQRLAIFGVTPKFGQAAETFLHGDPRPVMWHEYATAGLTHPWFGVGFGRTVPALAYDMRTNEALIAVHANTTEHAHNVILDWWLQVGSVGLLVAVSFVVSTLRTAWHKINAGRIAALAGVASITLIVLILLRNLTDDLLVFGFADACGVALGALLGVSAHLPIVAAVNDRADAGQF